MRFLGDGLILDGNLNVPSIFLLSIYIPYFEIPGKLLHKLICCLFEKKKDEIRDHPLNTVKMFTNDDVFKTR